MVLDLGIGQEVGYKGQEAQVIDFSLPHNEGEEQDICILFRDGTSLWTSPERLYEENPDLVDLPCEDEEDYDEYEGYDDYDI